MNYLRGRRHLAPYTARALWWWWWLLGNLLSVPRVHSRTCCTYPHTASFPAAQSPKSVWEFEQVPVDTITREPAPESSAPEFQWSCCRRSCSLCSALEWVVQDLSTSQRMDLQRRRLSEVQFAQTQHVKTGHISASAALLTNKNVSSDTLKYGDFPSEYIILPALFPAKTTRSRTG